VTLDESTKHFNVHPVSGKHVLNRHLTGENRITLKPETGMYIASTVGVDAQSFQGLIVQ